MSYIGNSPALKYASFAVQHFTTSATTSYSLDNSVANENDIALFINNVRQQPGGSYAYTAAGTTLTLSAATTSSDTMYCVFIGKAVQTVTPPVNSVGTSQLVADSVTTAKILDDNVTTAKILDDNVTTAKILDTNVTGAKLNDDAISAQGALGAEPADTDEFLVSDAGVLKRVDYSYIKGITQTSFLPIATPLWYNGDMQVAQRGASATGKTASGYYACDRMHLNLSSLGTWTIAQETLTSGNAYADGFQKAFRLDCTTADASPSASAHGYFRQKFEGQDVQVFKKGTANAETYTLAFWVKSNKTGTDIFTCGLYDHDNSRSVFQNYTISSADTWEYKVLNFPKDTTGVIDSDNAVSIDVRWYLGAGSNFTGGTQATTAWEAQTSANNLPSGKVNIADSTSNDIAITGVQLEVGTYTSSDLPPFRHESFGDNLARCQRYYFKMTRDTTNQAVGMGRYWSTAAGGGGGMFNFPVPMRGAVAMDFENGTSYWTSSGGSGGTNDYFDGMIQNDYGATTSGWYMSAGGNGTVGYGFIVMTNSTSAIAAWDSEL